MYECDRVEQWLNTKPIGQQHAQDIADLQHEWSDLLSHLNGTPIVIEFSGRNPRTVGGFCHNRTRDKKFGRIVLNMNGQDWGHLAHELAHLATPDEMHSWRWYNACVGMRRELAEMARRSTIDY